jgi:hypothetical protein
VVHPAAQLADVCERCYGARTAQGLIHRPKSFATSSTASTPLPSSSTFGFSSQNERYASVADKHLTSFHQAPAAPMPSQTAVGMSMRICPRGGGASGFSFAYADRLGHHSFSRRHLDVQLAEQGQSHAEHTGELNSLEHETVCKLVPCFMQGRPGLVRVVTREGRAWGSWFSFSFIIP